MRLVRYGAPRVERPGVLVSGGAAFDASSVTHDYDQEFFASGGLNRLREALLGAALEPTSLDGVRLGPPIAKPHQVICVGLNYRDHAAETGMEVPAEPVLFNKSPGSVVGPDDDVLIPRGGEKLDWEAELAVVIGKETSYLGSTEGARDSIAGYTISNDVTERAFQFERGGQWVKGKSAPTFNPMGPWLVTPDEIADDALLNISLTVNGRVMQNSSTAHMIFGVEYLVWYISQFLVLEPGDVINTGTPPGVGHGLKPAVYLVAGDVMELTIDGLGSQRQTVRATELPQ